MITVVKVNAKRDNFDLYIGREFADFQASPFQNPYHIGPDGDRTDVLIKFALMWYSPEQKKLRRASEIFVPPNARLGCWCRTDRIPFDELYCHGDIIAGYLNWKDAQAQQRQGGLF